MAERAERVTEVVDNSTAAPAASSTVTQTHESRVGGTVLLARIVQFITSVIVALLAIRLILVLLGANKGSAFVDFIYSVSHPFVSPFFGMFSYSSRYGVSHFEAYTVVAILVYALVGYGIARLVTIANPSRTAEV